MIIPLASKVIPALTQPFSEFTPPVHSVRKITVIVGSACLAGLSLFSGSLAGIAVADAITGSTVQQIRSHNISRAIGNSTWLSDLQHDNVTQFQQQIQDAEKIAAEEKWGLYEIPDDIPDDYPTMISAGFNYRGADCLEEDTDQKLISVKPCTGSGRQRFKIKDSVISTNAGHCLSPPDDSSIIALTENGSPEKATNCSVKLIACPEQPIKIRLINNMLLHKNYVLTIRNDAIICYLDTNSVKNFYYNDLNHYKYGTYFTIFSDWFHKINRCKYDKRAFEYPVTCESDNNKEFTIQERRSISDHKKFCNELIKPEIPAFIPDIQDFQLKMPKDSRRIEHTLFFDRSFIPRSNQNGMIKYSKKYIFTGLYTQPGDVFTLKVSNITSLDNCQNALKGMELQVNMHTDDLSNNIICYEENKDKFIRRPPSLHIVRQLYKGLNTVRSPYGGTIWITAPQACAQCKFQVDFNNVFHAPHFKLGKTSSLWTVNATTSPPWSVLEGRRLTSVLPTTLAAELKKPKAVVELMDQMVDESLKLWGYDVDMPYPGKHHHPGNQNDIIVDDIQIRSGSAHAGNDINQGIMVEHKHNPVKILDKIATDNTTLNRSARRTLFPISIIPHELGHHFHPHRILTSIHKQTIAELTAEYVNEKVFGLSLIAQSCSYKRASEIALRQNLDYSAFPMNFQSDFLAAAVFLREIIDAFPKKNWDIFTNMARHYRSLNAEDSQQLITASPQDRTDYFFEILCNITHHNLVNHFEVWKITLSESIKSKVSHLPVTDQPFSILSRKNRRIHPKIEGDAPHCPVSVINTEFSESQYELITTYAFLAITYGLYLIAEAEKCNKQKNSKIKTV